VRTAGWELKRGDLVGGVLGHGALAEYRRASRECCGLFDSRALVLFFTEGKGKTDPVLSVCGVVALLLIAGGECLGSLPFLRGESGRALARIVQN